ncbi:hypothetical protein L208DRAFT_1348078 [Tricholoma matsutake]|nr:hypothetical protein L208DRAFT_1348078 [Tricholoma matsutake 945]
MRWHISTDIKQLVLRLATVCGYKYKKIHEISGVSERTTKHICALHQRTGDVVKKGVVDGGPHLLNGFHISFLESCVEQQPDLLLSELQDQLEGTCRVQASPMTTHCALRQCGLSCKRVIICLVQVDLGEPTCIITGDSPCYTAR